ncbi:hypothetical protein OsI_00276 [Oryza sativa Indica Group]|uniref:Uncharacterized protein n=1 Tax=Oryza sativa subsp. indica TaxID=39946 RepID=B8AD41_ORYSI|nr:hypothetical protein OsI_00276 [Oryza sativa Indica Group]
MALATFPWLDLMAWRMDEYLSWIRRRLLRVATSLNGLLRTAASSAAAVIAAAPPVAATLSELVARKLSMDRRLLTIWYQSYSVRGISHHGGLRKAEVQGGGRIGQGGVQESSTHNLFDRMPSQHKTRGKFNQILQKLEEVEARRSKAAEKTIAAIKATTAVLKAKSPTAPMAPPTPAPTKCLTECPNNNLTWATVSSSHITEDTAPTAAWELGNNKHKGHASCIVTKDSPEVTPTMCSTKCSGPTVEPDLTVAAVVTSATTAAASMELAAAGNAIGATYINNLDHPKVTHAKCSMSGSGVKRGTEQVVLAFPLMASPVEFTTSLVEPSPPTGLKLGAAICVGDQVPMKCSMKCTESDNKPLMEHPKRNPWPPAWLGWKKWYVSWTAVNYSEMRFYFIPPWPPPLKVGWLALVFSKFGAAHTDMMDIMLHWTDMKPWPPPNQNLRSIMVHLFAWKHWKVSVEVSLFAWNTKQYMNSVLLITVGTKWLIHSAVKDCFLQGKPFKLVDPLELMQVILVLLVRDPDVEMFQIGSYSLQPENYQLTNYLVARLLKQGNLKKVLDGVDHSKNIKKSDVDVGEDNPGNISTAAKMFIDVLVSRKIQRCYVHQPSTLIIGLLSCWMR